MTAHAERRGALTVEAADDGAIDLRDVDGVLVAIVLSDSRDPEASLVLAHQISAAPLLVEALEAENEADRLLHKFMGLGKADLSIPENYAALSECERERQEAVLHAWQLRRAALDAARAPERSEVDGDG